MAILRLIVKNNPEGCPSFEITCNPVSALAEIFVDPIQNPRSPYTLRPLSTPEEERTIDLSSVLNTKQFRAPEQRYLILPSPERIQSMMAQTPPVPAGMDPKTAQSSDDHGTWALTVPFLSENNGLPTPPSPVLPAFSPFSPISHLDLPSSEFPLDQDHQIQLLLSARRVLIKPYEILDFLQKQGFKHLGSHVEAYGRDRAVCDVHTFIGTSRPERKSMIPPTTKRSRAPTTDLQENAAPSFHPLIVQGTGPAVDTGVLRMMDLNRMKLSTYTIAEEVEEDLDSKFICPPHWDEGRDFNTGGVADRWR